MSYPWYSRINDKSDGLQQGDLIPNCPLVIPPETIKEGENCQFDVELIDSIILSQSCDLENGKIRYVLVCPYYPLKTWLEGLPPNEQSSKAKVKNVENLRKGNIAGYHLLHKGEQDPMLPDYQVVDFKDVYAIHLSALKEHINKMENRVRLLPPYREHLSQAFARFIMRVGLPQDIKVQVEYI